jgi:uncharacterized membrane protein
MSIRNPVEWTAGSVESTAHAARLAAHWLVHPDVDPRLSQPELRLIAVSDLKDVLVAGFNDFLDYRTDVIFICLIYPLAGIVLAWATTNYNLLPLLFPLVSGFALIGPFAAAGLYEMSRLREQGKPISWVDAFGVFRSPSIAEIIKLGLLLAGIFLIWLLTAMAIYRLTLGPAMPTSVSSFAATVFTTAAGWTLIVLGVGVGFLFALVVLATSVVSFPLLLDRRVRISTAVRTSVRAAVLNPIPVLAWGLIVACSLVLGALPLLLGLIVVMPVLGHATWHLYRRMVRPQEPLSPGPSIGDPPESL